MIGVIASLLGGGIGKAVSTVAKTIGDWQSGKIEAKIAMAEIAVRVPTMQMEINKIEANHPSLFVSGWRPFIGWICGAGFGYAFLIQPLVNGFIGMLGYEQTFPSLDTGTLVSIVVPMLGLAGYRSYEKVKGLAKDNLQPTIPPVPTTDETVHNTTGGFNPR